MAALAHSLRRPRAFLRHVERWWSDDSAIVRSACLEGVALAAILEATGPAQRPEIGDLLEAGANDAAPAVRQAALEASWLLSPMGCQPSYDG